MMHAGVMNPRKGSNVMGAHDEDNEDLRARANSINQDMEQELVRSNSSGNNSDFENADGQDLAAGGEEDDPEAAYVVGQLRSIAHQ
jgi:hypothetical protein